MMYYIIELMSISGNLFKKIFRSPFKILRDVIRAMTSHDSDNENKRFFALFWARRNIILE